MKLVPNLESLGEEAPKNVKRKPTSSGINASRPKRVRKTRTPPNLDTIELSDGEVKEKKMKQQKLQKLKKVH